MQCRCPLQFVGSLCERPSNFSEVSLLPSSWLLFRDYEGKRLLYFTGLLSYRPVLKEIRYSLNGDALDKTFEFKPSEKMYEPGTDIFVAVPNDTESAQVQVTFKDGTKSAVQKFLSKP